MVYITRDIHGSLEPIYDMFAKYHPNKDDIIVILGDVGVNYTGTLQDIGIKKAMSKLGSIFFCIHGNHENRPQNIASYEEKEWNGGRVMYEEDFPNLLFPIDGEIFDIEGKKCIVIGGAYSVDKFYRLRNGYRWWADEQPSPKIKKYVEKQLSENKIDFVFSHTCPAKYIPTECFLSGIDQSRVDNSTEEWLDTIEDKIEYLHVYKQFIPIFNIDAPQFKSYLIEHRKKYGENHIITSSRIPKTGYNLIDRSEFDFWGKEYNSQNLSDFLIGSSFIIFGYIDPPKNNMI